MTLEDRGSCGGAGDEKKKLKREKGIFSDKEPMKKILWREKSKFSFTHDDFECFSDTLKMCQVYFKCPWTLNNPMR